MRTLLLLATLLAGCSPRPAPSHPLPIAKATLGGKVHAVGTPCNQPGPGCDGPAVDYEVIVLAKDGTTQIAKVKTDATGAYTVALPGGEYTVITPAGPNGQTRRNDVAVVAGATATLDLDLDTGVR